MAQKIQFINLNFKKNIYKSTKNVKVLVFLVNIINSGYRL